MELDDERHAVAPEEDLVEGKEVGVHSACCLSGVELGPGWALSLECRWGAVVAHYGRDGRLRHADAECLELADDAEIAPLGALPGLAEDQFDGLLGKGGTTRSAMGVGPVPLGQRPVPAQDRPWADEERSPVVPRPETGEDGDGGPVGPGKPGTGDLPTEDG